MDTVLKKLLEDCLWAIQEMRKQHVKIMLEGQPKDEDWVTKKCDRLEIRVRKYLKRKSV